MYSDDIAKGQAVELAFGLASSDEQRVEEVALILRCHIIESKQGAEDMAYPPTTSWFLSKERQPLNLLRDFLANLVSGKAKETLSATSLICELMLSGYLLCDY